MNHLRPSWWVHRTSVWRMMRSLARRGFVWRDARGYYHRMPSRPDLLIDLASNGKDSR